MIFNRITQTSLDASIVYHSKTGVFATLLLESLAKQLIRFTLTVHLSPLSSIGSRNADGIYAVAMVKRPSTMTATRCWPW